MYCTRKVAEDIYWIGGSDRRLALFENLFPIPRGVAYNSYLIMDEKTVVMDTVDASITRQFIENIAHVLQGRPLDYLVVNHMEPDHCANIEELLVRYPEMKIVGNAKTHNMIRQFYDADLEGKIITVKEGDTLALGKRTLHFFFAPMVHWPEVMVSWEETDKILFSADAFGSFGALNGNIFNDELNFDRDWLADARRYYTNIVGKYGPQVQNALKKLSALEIQMICPLHGPIWRENLGWFIDKYMKWSSYTPEDQAVMIAYGSVYGHTENLANVLASKLADLGVKDVRVYDVSATHPSYILSEAFRCSHLVFASITYNGGIFTNMEHLLLELKAHNLQNRTVALMENGSWAPVAGKKMKEIFDSMKNIRLLEETAVIRSSMKENQMEQVDALAKAIVESM